MLIRWLFIFLLSVLPQIALAVAHVEVQVHRSHDGAALAGARVAYTLQFEGGETWTIEATTNALGQASLYLDEITATPMTRVKPTLKVAPNPTGAVATVHCRLPAGADPNAIELELFDLRGHRLARSGPGDRTMEFNHGGLAAGVYLLRLKDQKSDVQASTRLVSADGRLLRLDIESTPLPAKAKHLTSTAQVLVSKPGYFDNHETVTIPDGHHSHQFTLDRDPDPSLSRTWFFQTDLGTNAAAADSGWVPAGIDTAFFDRTIVLATPTQWRFWQGSHASPDSSTIRWDAAGIFTTGSRDNEPPTNTAHRSQFWMDLSTLHESDLVIEDAWLIVSPASNASLPWYEGARTWAVMDTVMADRAWLNAPLHDSIDGAVVSTWNHPDPSIQAPWKPGLAERDDWFDFGPRSQPATHQATGQSAMRLDVTDVLQQYVDRRERRVNAGWLITGTVPSSYSVALGPGENAVAKQPLLVVTVSRRPRLRPWGDGVLPVIMTVDDADTCQMGYLAACQEAGGTFGSVLPANAIRGYSTENPNKMTVADLNILRDAGIEIIPHTRNHASIGEIPWGDRLTMHEQIGRDWLWEVFGAEVDTASFSNFAYPYNNGESFSAWALQQLVAHGYQSARTPFSEVNLSGLGLATRLSWNEPVNLYGMAVEWVVDAFGPEGSDPGPAQLQENLAELIHKCWGDGQAAIHIFWHDSKVKTDAGGGWEHGVDRDELTWFLEAIAARDNVRSMSLQDALEVYLETAQFIPPPRGLAPIEIRTLYDEGWTEFGQIWAIQP